MKRRTVDFNWEDEDSQACFAEWFPFPDASTSAQDVDRIEAFLCMAPPLDVLDVGCGNGRHAIELARRGYRVVGIDVAKRFLEEARGVAKKAENDVWAALRRGGLDGLLDRVYCFRSVGFRKPSREFFEFIVRDLALPRSQTVMVGDNFEMDVAGANAADIRAVWLAEAHEAHRTDEMHRTIFDIGDLPLALQQWTGIGTDRTGA